MTYEREYGTPPVPPDQKRRRRRGWKFYKCPFCGYIDDAGFTGIEYRYDLGEVWLSNGTFIEHKHLGVDLPDPNSLRISG